MKTWCEEHPNAVLWFFIAVFAVHVTLAATQYADDPSRTPAWWALKSFSALVMAGWIRAWWRRT